MEQSNKAFSAALVKSLRGERGHLPNQECFVGYRRGSCGKTQSGAALFYLSISETHDLLARFSLISRSGQKNYTACPCERELA